MNRRDMIRMIRTGLGSADRPVVSNGLRLGLRDRVTYGRTTQQRTPELSAAWCKEVIRRNRLV